MNLILFDDPAIREHLLPLTFTRPTGAIRTGILTIAEKWERWLEVKASWSTQPYLQNKFPLETSADNLFINGAVCPDENLVRQITGLGKGSALISGNTILAARTDEPLIPSNMRSQETSPVLIIDRVWKIFQNNGAQIREDFKLITAGKKSVGIQDKHTRIYNETQIFVEEGAEVRAAVLNAENGPIYLGKNSQIQDGALIRGPFALCEGSQVNMGAKVRGDTTVGPVSKIGGEVSNSVLFGYSNKAHDGFLGNSVIGEWCNIGADTNTSNLKNNYENIKLWSYATDTLADTGLLFCGLVMGDHSKCGINTMFNTGTVVGVSASIFGAGYPPTFVPSFSWGGAGGFTTFDLPRALLTAARAMERRGKDLESMDQSILTEVYQLTAKYRSWEKK